MSIAARPPYFVPETKRASELLAEIRELPESMVIVVDEYVPLLARQRGASDSVLPIVFLSIWVGLLIGGELAARRTEIRGRSLSMILVAGSVAMVIAHLSQGILLFLLQPPTSFNNFVLEFDVLIPLPKVEGRYRDDVTSFNFGGVSLARRHRLMIFLLFRVKAHFSFRPLDLGHINARSSCSSMAL